MQLYWNHMQVYWNHMQLYWNHMQLYCNRIDFENIKRKYQTNMYLFNIFDRKYVEFE